MFSMCNTCIVILHFLHSLLKYGSRRFPSRDRAPPVFRYRRESSPDLFWRMIHDHRKRRCEITIISFSRSIYRGRLAALIGVTGKPYPSCLSCHSHPIRPCGHLPLEGKAAIREYHLLKKGGEAATSTLNPEP